MNNNIYLVILFCICVISAWVLLWQRTSFSTQRGISCIDQTLLRPNCIDEYKKWWERKAYFGGVPQTKGITLVTHGDIKKLFLLNKTMSIWEGEVSFCIYLPLQDLHKTNLQIIDNLRHQWGTRLILTIFSSDESYPINILRNRALQQVKTELFFAIDLDFIPEPYLYSYVMSHYDIFIKNAERAVFVVPAFHYNVQLNNDSYFHFEKYNLPVTKEEAVRDIKSERLIYGHWGKAQLSTEVNKWCNTSRIYQLQSTNWNYEPYVVAGLKHVPYHDERFLAYGDDKTQWHRHLTFLGFEYWVLPSNFIIHIPHWPHTWSGKERKAASTLVYKWIKEFGIDLEKGKLISSSSTTSTTTTTTFLWMMMLIIMLFIILLF